LLGLEAAGIEPAPGGAKTSADSRSNLLGDPERGAEAFELISSIHDLLDLAKRPPLLHLIAGRLGELKDLKARGERVNAAPLYELVVHSWLDRAEGTHPLDSHYTRRLLEELAAALWREASQSWRWEEERLEEWFDEYLAHHPALASASVNPDRRVLKEELRAATFGLRYVMEEKHFRFAHQSVQQYLLAAYLTRALNEGRLERWAFPRVAPETLDFLPPRASAPWKAWGPSWEARTSRPPCWRSATGCAPSNRGCPSRRLPRE
jgi:hypothetical protein